MTVAIGKRTVDLFTAAEILWRRTSDGATTTTYLANRSWISNADDSIAPNRAYIGTLLENYSFEWSLFSGEKIGGQSKLNRGLLRSINPKGTAHSLDWIFEEGWLAVSVTHRMGEIGEDLDDMLVRTTAARGTRSSSDGFLVEIDLADDGQELDTSILIDRFQGYGACVQFDPGVNATVPDNAGLNPSSAFCLDVAYCIPWWADMSSDLQLIARGASGGGNVYRIDFLANGKVRVLSRTSGGATVTLDATDLLWVADGRFHRVVAKWDNTTDTLRAFHSTRTGGALSAITAAQSTIQTGSGALEWGDVGNDLGGGLHDWVRIAQVSLEKDANVPTDAEILARMKRPLSDDEVADCEGCWRHDENTGTTAEDSSPQTHNATVPNEWRDSFEGTAELVGTAKPLCFGRRKAVPVLWSNEGERVAALHARCIKGASAVFEGALRYTVGWETRLFLGCDFDAATKTISLPLRTNVGGADRLDAQPGFSGPSAGQLFEVEGSASNDNTYTVVSADERAIVVAESLFDESDADIFITMNGDAEHPEPAATLHHEAGAISIRDEPGLPLAVALFGDIGAEIPTDDDEVHFPEFVPAIMRCILRDWGGQATLADNFDNGVDEPANPIGAYFARAGCYVDPKREAKIRDVLAKGADSIWARWGQDLATDEWDLEVMTDPPATTAAVSLTDLEILAIEEVQSIPPVGGFVLRAAMNDVVLTRDQLAQQALAADKTAMQQPYLEGRAAIDSTVAAAYPQAATPDAIETWLLEQSDGETEAQRRYDILKHKHVVYRARVLLFGLDKEPFRDHFNVTDEDFAPLVSGRNLWAIRMDAKDELLTWTYWGRAA